LEDGQPVGLKENIMIKVEDADLINYAYAYDGFGSTQVSRPKKKSSDFLKNITKEWDDYENSRKTQNKILPVANKLSRGEEIMDDISSSFETFSSNGIIGG
jgi:hypothetical protein